MHMGRSCAFRWEIERFMNAPAKQHHSGHGNLHICSEDIPFRGRSDLAENSDVVTHSSRRHVSLPQFLPHASVMVTVLECCCLQMRCRTFLRTQQTSIHHHYQAPHNNHQHLHRPQIEPPQMEQPPLKQQLHLIHPQPPQLPRSHQQLLQQLPQNLLWHLLQLLQSLP